MSVRIFTQKGKPISVELKRGKNKILTKAIKMLDPTTGICVFHEKLEMFSTLFKKPIESHFQEKIVYLYRQN